MRRLGPRRVSNSKRGREDGERGWKGTELEIYVPMECTIYVEGVVSMCTSYKEARTSAGK
jgi:hypothetical protein